MDIQEDGNIQRCPYCKSAVVLVDSSVVYGKSYGKIYLCSNYPRCDAYVGVHERTGKPKGTLANAELRSWRKKAHAAFDPLWKGDTRQMTRHRAYGVLCHLMKLPRTRAHIGLFTVAQCKEVIEKVEQWKQQHMPPKSSERKKHESNIDSSTSC